MFEKQITLSAFKENSTISLCKVGRLTSTRGRSPNDIESPRIQTSRKPANKSVRLDHMYQMHWSLVN